MESAMEPFDALDLSLLSASLEWALTCNRYSRGQLAWPEFKEAWDTWELAVKLYGDRGRTLDGFYARMVAARAAATPPPAMVAR